ncbi:MAG: alkaline phosphatase family protein [Byssovorax sp.]
MSSTKRSFPLSILDGSACGLTMRSTLLHTAALVAALGVTACAVSTDNTVAGQDDGAASDVDAVIKNGQHVYDHVVVVIMENRSTTQINAKSVNGTYIHDLKTQGVNFTQAHAVTHPSEPNYLAMFSGSTQGVTDDSCPNSFNTTKNLGSQLINAGKSFKGYSESMPNAGYTGCDTGNYARKHNPWVMFPSVPAASNLTFSDFPKLDYTKLPTVSFVVPNLCSDMHDCSFSTGDNWLRNNLAGYVKFAKANNSLLILTWDEDDSDSANGNDIPAVFVGAFIKPGTTNSQSYNHYNLLATLEDMYNLPRLNNASGKPAITNWYACQNAEPVDVAGYHDAQGYLCSDWKGFDCNQAAEQYGYTAAQESSIIKSCGISCNICP